MPTQGYKPVIGIYALKDPSTGRVMYVGQSIDVDFRFRQHMDRSKFGGNLNLYRWFERLWGKRTEPALEVLETVSHFYELDPAEIRWIHFYKSRGEAEFNRSAGGKGRGVPVVANSHPDDWHQFAIKHRQMKRLLFDMAHMAGNICDTKSTDFWLVTERKIQHEIYRMEEKITAVFPEWEDVCLQLRQEERDEECLK